MNELTLYLPHSFSQRPLKGLSEFNCNKESFGQQTKETIVAESPSKLCVVLQGRRGESEKTRKQTTVVTEIIMETTIITKKMINDNKERQDGDNATD